MASLPETTDQAPHGATEFPSDRAWGVLLGAALCMFCGQSGVGYYTFGVFQPEIVADTGWPASAVAAAIGPGVLIAGLAAVLVGRACDRWGVRTVTLAGGPAYALGLALLGLAPTSARSFTAILMLMWLLAFAGSPIPYSHAVTSSFDRRRGLALGIIFCAGALGIAFWPPLAARLIAVYGWRHAYVIMGSISGAVVLSSAIILLKSAPDARSARSTVRSAAEPTVGTALRTTRFWKICAIFLILSGVLGGTAVNLPVILRHNGAQAQAAAAILTVVGVGMFLGRLILGAFLDRWFAPHVIMAITAVSMIAFAILLSSTDKAAFVAAAACIGIGLGAEFAAAAYIVSRAFGFSSFGAIYGLVMLASVIGAAIGPAVIGPAVVRGVAVPIIYGTELAALALAIVILTTLRRADLPFGGR